MSQYGGQSRYDDEEPRRYHSVYVPLRYLDVDCSLTSVLGVRVPVSATSRTMCARRRTSSVARALDPAIWSSVDTTTVWRISRATSRLPVAAS